MVGPKPQPSIYNPEAEKVILDNKGFVVLVDKDNPCFAFVWKYGDKGWSKLPFHVTYHKLGVSTKAVTTKRPTGKRDPVFTCDCHNHDSIYRPTGFCCEHILAAKATGKMEPGDHVNKSYPTAKMMLKKRQR